MERIFPQLLLKSCWNRMEWLIDTLILTSRHRELANTMRPWKSSPSKISIASICMAMKLKWRKSMTGLVHNSSSNTISGTLLHLLVQSRWRSESRTSSSTTSGEFSRMTLVATSIQTTRLLLLATALIQNMETTGSFAILGVSSKNFNVENKYL